MRLTNASIWLHGRKGLYTRVSTHLALVRSDAYKRERGMPGGGYSMFDPPYGRGF